jgi:hypothetical protein
MTAIEGSLNNPRNERPVAISLSGILDDTLDGAAFETSESLKDNAAEGWDEELPDGPVKEGYCVECEGK